MARRKQRDQLARHGSQDLLQPQVARLKLLLKQMCQEDLEEDEGRETTFHV